MSYDKIAKQLEDPTIKLDKLVQYAQGMNPLVPEFLALGEIKRRETLNQHTAPTPVPQTTVAQDLATKAMAPQMPMQQMPQPPQQGIAGIPPQAPPQALAALPSGMSQQSFAGGGIVAFAGDNPEGSLVKDDRNWFEKWRDSLYSPSETYLSDIMRGKKATPPKGEVPVSAETIEGMRHGKAPPITSADIKRRMPEEKIKGNEQALFDAEALAKKIAPKGEALPTVGEKGRMAPTTPADSTPKENMYDKYEKMLLSQQADSKKAREQDKYMRLLEAGLGIMGGTSPHAMVNIGQGAMGAAKGYAQDKAAAQKEDRQTVMDLMGLGLKREDAQREAQKLAMTEKLYGSHGRYYEAAADAAKARAANAGATGIKDKDFIAAVNRAYSTDVAAAKTQFGRELNSQELSIIYAEAEARVRSTLGMPGGGINAAAQPIGSWTPQGGFKPLGS